MDLIYTENVGWVSPDGLRLVTKKLWICITTHSAGSLAYIYHDTHWQTNLEVFTNMVWAVNHAMDRQARKDRFNTQPGHIKWIVHDILGSLREATYDVYLLFA